MRTGILGGSFDPVHLGHVALAEAAMKHLRLDEVVFVPNARNPLRKPSHASAQQRLDMCRLALADHSAFTVSDIEVTRGGRSFAVDTVEEFAHTIGGELWFILGADALRSLKEWKQPDRLSRLCRLGAVTRPPEDISRVLSILGEPYDERIDEIPMAVKPVSSSRIRDDILRGASPEMHLHPDVWSYIKAHGLYKE